MTKTDNFIANPVVVVKLRVFLSFLLTRFSKLHLKKMLIVLLTVLSAIMLLNDYRTKQNEAVYQQGLRLIQSPQVNDVYFLDFRLISDIRRPKQNFRVAKVFDVTGDVITLRYSELLFEHKRGAMNSVRYGHLRYKEYFQVPRINLTKQQLNTWMDNGAIYQIERPVRGKLYGNYVSPHKPFYRVPPHMPGKREYQQGLAFLALKYDELADNKAFHLIKSSAELGSQDGQIKLAEMYLAGVGIQQDKKQSLYWLKRASLAGSEAAIYKYAIVCQQVIDCRIDDFYQQLIENGISITIENKPK